MNLETGMVNKVTKVIELPITDSVIKAVNQMAADQGCTKLKIESRNKIPLCPADWLAGVDMEDDDDIIPHLFCFIFKAWETSLHFICFRFGRF